MPRAVIAGAGVFGASLAHRLAGDGWEVVLVDPWEPGHARAASGGESRLMRSVHGPDAEHARSARRARELWRALEAETGDDLFVECGVVWLTRREDGWEAAAERVLRAEGIPVERVEPRTLFPSVADHDLVWALWEPEAGLLRAAAATRALARAAVARGAELVAGRARPDGDRAVVGDRVLEGDVVVWACGGWLPACSPGSSRPGSPARTSCTSARRGRGGPRRPSRAGSTTTARPTDAATSTAGGSRSPPTRRGRTSIRTATGARRCQAPRRPAAPTWPIASPPWPAPRCSAPGPASTSSRPTPSGWWRRIPTMGRCG